MPRIKLPLAVLASRDEAELVMNEVAKIANNKRKLVARLDAAILKLQDDAAPALAQCDQETKLKIDALHAWAESNPQAFPKGKKSIVFLSGTLGFRTGTPKLQPLSRAFTWDKITELVCQFLPNFTRSRLEVDKEAIIAQRGEPAIAQILPRCGLKVVQAESFFVEPALTDAAPAPAEV